MRSSDRFVSLFKKLSPIFLFLVLVFFFSIQSEKAISVENCCFNNICDPAKGEKVTCPDDCAPKPACDEKEACNPIPNGCCPGSTANGVKCQGVDMRQLDFDPDCVVICYEHSCPNGLLDRPTETCEKDSAGNEKFATGIICKVGSCNTTGPSPCHCCGDKTVENSEECDPPDGIICGYDCKKLFCGDGKITGAEECDPKAALTGCALRQICNDISCQCEMPPPDICGDGKITGMEKCEKDTDCGADEVCTNCQCVKKPAIACGNGIYEKDNNESCDTPQSGVCGSNACRPSRNVDPNEPAPCTCCGDRIPQVAAGEECDSGPDNGKQGNGCDATCHLVPPPTLQCGNHLIDGSETCDGATRAVKIIDFEQREVVCQQDCRDKNSPNPCSCCGDLNLDAPSEDCDPPNGVTCDNQCKTITRAQTPPEKPAPEPQTSTSASCTLEGAGWWGCGPNLSKELPNPCVASILEPTLWQMISPFTFLQWIGSILIPGILFGLVRLKKR